MSKVLKLSRKGSDCSKALTWGEQSGEVYKQQAQVFMGTLDGFDLSKAAGGAGKEKEAEAAARVARDKERERERER